MFSICLSTSKLRFVSLAPVLTISVLHVIEITLNLLKEAQA